MFGIGIPELIIIALAFGILFFGSNKVTEFARSMGRFTGEFKKGKQAVEHELRSGEEEGRKSKKS
jgi:sec-independent protein translocase protein TatA